MMAAQKRGKIVLAVILGGMVRAVPVQFMKVYIATVGILILILILIPVEVGIAITTRNNHNL